jgi:transcriptional regulator with XRE-family HTH domain
VDDAELTEWLEPEKRARLYRIRRIALNVRCERRGARLSQVALADRAGLSHGRVRALEELRHVPTDEDLSALARALGTTTQQLEN